MKNALNVLMVTPCYFPYMGGVQTHVYEVGRRLVRRGINVTLLTTVAHSFAVPLPKMDIVEGMRIIRVQAWPRERDYYIAPEIYSLIKIGKWDLIHCQGCHTFVPPMAMLAARKAHIPYVLTFHSAGNSSLFRTSIRRMQWQLLRPLLTDASMLIGVSHFEVDYFRMLLRLPTSKLAVVPNGGNLPDLPSKMDVLPKPSLQPLIISIGRLERYKGHQYLITALPYIHESILNARLLILGAGPYEASLRALAQRVGVAEHVEIRSISGCDRQKMAEILSQAMLVALLSEYESQSIAVLEALALRRPVLVANTSALSEFVKQGLVRAVSLQSTPEQIAQAVLQQIMDPLIPLPSFVLPTWDECAEQLEAVYNTCTERKK